MSDFDELAGRIEAVASLLGNLIAVLEDSHQLDGATLAHNTRNTAQGLCFAGPHLQATKRTLIELADSIDAARTIRQSRQHT